MAALKPEPLANAPKPSDADDVAAFPLADEGADLSEFSLGAAPMELFSPGGGEGADETGDVAPEAPLPGVCEPKLEPSVLGLSPPEADAEFVGAASQDREPLAPVTKGDEEVEAVKEANVGCVREEEGAPGASAGDELGAFALLLNEAKVGCVFTGTLVSSALLLDPSCASSDAFAASTLSSVLGRFACFSCQSRSCTLFRICLTPGASPSAPSIELRIAVAEAPEPATLLDVSPSSTSSCGNKRFFFAGTASGVDGPC